MSKRSGDIFDLIDEWMRRVDEMLRNIEMGFMTSIRTRETRRFGPYVYGFRVTIGPDGVPKVEHFNNFNRVTSRPMILEEREPLIDVLDRGNEIKVVAEVPGVNKENIKVMIIGGNKLVITAKSDERQYHKEIDLPADVDEKSAKANYKNGVLEITLQKKSSSGVEIKVE